MLKPHPYSSFILILTNTIPLATIGISCEVYSCTEDSCMHHNIARTSNPVIAIGALHKTVEAEKSIQTVYADPG